MFVQNWSSILSEKMWNVDAHRQTGCDYNSSFVNLRLIWAEYYTHYSKTPIVPKYLSSDRVVAGRNVYSKHKLGNFSLHQVNMQYTTRVYSYVYFILPINTNQVIFSHQVSMQYTTEYIHVYFIFPRPSHFAKTTL